MKKSLLFTLVLLSTLCFSAGAFCEKVTVATLNWAPYISENMDNQGYVAQIIHKSFESQGYDVELKYWPWARTVAMAEKGKVDAYGPEYYAEKLNELHHVSEPFQGGPAGLFRLKGSDITYETLEDLKGYRIGVVRGYVNEEEFDKADFLEKDPVKDDLTNIKKLLAGRIDLFFCDKYVGKWLAKQNGYDPGKIGRAHV